MTGTIYRTWRVVPLLTALIALSCGDLAFTLWAHYRTPFFEMNPVAAALLAGGAVGWLIAYKMGMTLGASAIFWKLRKHWRAEFALWLMVLAYLILTLQWINYIVFIVTESPKWHVVAR
jgi:hypothetical protein